MKAIKSLSFILLLTFQPISAQKFVGIHYLSREFNGNKQNSFIMVPEINYSSKTSFLQTREQNFIDSFGTMVRWTFSDPVAMGTECTVSGNGEYSAVGWNLNNQRLSLYGNTNSTPIWEYNVTNNYTIIFVSLNYDGELIAATADVDVYVFNNSSNVPFFDFDVRTLGGDPKASNIALAQNKNFLIATASYYDSSTVLGFETASTTPVWSTTLVPYYGTGIGSGAIQGLKLSGNDSLMIVNTYGDFWVIKTFTGEIIYHDLINPLSSSGTQTSQGISYDGRIISTVNFRGYMRVFEWNGSTYNFLWEDQEPPGINYNWATSVDVSNNGKYIAVGTLIFLPGSEYDGSIKLYKTSDGGSVFWKAENCGEFVNTVVFNDPANVLAASCWGAIDNSTPDLYVFKVLAGNAPIFTLSTPGSLFDVAISSDGSTLITSGKAIPARIFGYGGLAYNVFVDTSQSFKVITVLDPNGGEIIDGGSNYEIVWNSQDVENVKLEYSINNGASWNVITDSTQSTGSYMWEVPNILTTQGRIKISDSILPSIYDVSDETFRINQIVSVNESDLITEYTLNQNYPNPFNPSTTIKYEIPERSFVTVKIYDVLGNEINALVNEEKPAGEYEVEFDGTNLPSGVYFYQLRAGSYLETKKMVLLK